MKQLYTFLLMLPVMLFAQTDIDFQSINSGLPGPSWTWTADQNNTSFDVIDNPYSTSINTSTKVGKLTAEAGSNAWALAYSDGIGNFTFDADNTTVKIMVYKTRISPVEIKFEDSGNSAVYTAVTVSNTKINEWEELTFDFYNSLGSTFSKIVVIPDNLARADAQFITYFDNITFTTGTPPAMPSGAATTPTESSSDVISIFSDAYTDITANFSPPWDSADISEITVEGDAVKMYSNMITAGIDFTAVDVSSHGSIKIDYWTEGAAFLKVKLVDYLADGNWGNDNYQKEITHNISDFSTWNTITINLADFNLPVGKIGQILLTSDNTENVYVDNIYFSSTTGTVVDAVPSEAAPSPTRDAASVISIYSDTYTSVATNMNPAWGQSGTVDTAYDTGDGNNLLVYSNFNYQGTSIASSDISGMNYLHIDIWVASNDTRTVKVSPIGGGETLVTVATTPGAWNSVDIPVSSFTGVTTPEAVTELKFDGQFAADGARDTTVRSDVYLDNIYFYNDGSTNTGGGDTTPNTTTYCETELTHFNIDSHPGSILLTVENSGDDSITVTATSVSDVIDVLLIQSIEGGGTASATTITNGVATAEITWAAGTMPATTSFTLLWSDEASDGNQMVNAGTGNDGLGNVDTSNDCSQLGVVDLSDNTFMIYPNPVQNTLNVSAGVSVDQVSIFDLTGREVLRATPNASAFSLDVANLNKGLYLVSLKAGDQELTTKLVK